MAFFAQQKYPHIRSLSFLNRTCHQICIRCCCLLTFASTLYMAKQSRATTQTLCPVEEVRLCTRKAKAEGSFRRSDTGYSGKPAAIGVKKEQGYDTLCQTMALLHLASQPASGSTVKLNQPWSTLVHYVLTHNQSSALTTCAKHFSTLIEKCASGDPWSMFSVIRPEYRATIQHLAPGCRTRSVASKVNEGAIMETS